jgi:nucleoid-associated protein YejK
MSSFQTQYLKINRAIIHTVIARKPSEKHASTDLSGELVELNDYAKKLLIIRIQSAFSKASKAFELRIENTANDSFFGYVLGINKMTSDEFVNQSQEIATLLAESQTKPNIPGGFLIVIDAYDDLTKKSVAIAIKADQQEVLKYSNGKIEVLEKVFLSQAQKLFKIGVIFEQNHSSEDISRAGNFRGILFDDQFYAEKPAEYFFKDFLGFSIDENDKIQNLKFYKETEKFIKTFIKDYEQQVVLIRLLKSYIVDNKTALINPTDFSTQLLSDPKLLNKYNSDVVHQLPSSFSRNPTLIKSPLSNRKIAFKHNIKVSGPEDNFDSYVQVVSNRAELEELDFDDSNYTIVKIMGKPYNNE